MLDQERARRLVKRFFAQAWRSGLGWAGNAQDLEDLTDLVAATFVPRAAPEAEVETDQVLPSSGGRG